MSPLQFTKIYVIFKHNWNPL